MPPDPPPWCWLMLPHPGTSERHVMPTWDLHRHAFDMECPCGPVRDPEDHDMISHRAYDGREEYELGMRQRH